MLEPAALDPELDVLGTPDPVLDDARDLVTVPGHDPQPGVDVRLAVEALELGLVVVVRLPVVAKRLELGVEDGPVHIGADRAKLDALRQWRGGDVLE